MFGSFSSYRGVINAGAGIEIFFSSRNNLSYLWRVLMEFLFVIIPRYTSFLIKVDSIMVLAIVQLFFKWLRNDHKRVSSDVFCMEMRKIEQVVWL